MKILILTFHQEANYGANLQAYALHRHLCSLGHQANFLDYKRVHSGTPLLRVARAWIGRSPLSTIRKIRNRLLQAPIEHKKSALFADFQRCHLPSTAKPYRSLRDLAASPPNCDAYIVGSDQVWSPQIVAASDIPVYFLNFGPPTIRRIAYAASSGGESFPPGQHANILAFLRNFHRVGTRELSLRDHLCNIGFQNASWTPDPTFLVSWNQLLQIKKTPSTNSIGLFILNPSNYAKLAHPRIQRPPFNHIQSTTDAIVDFSNRPLTPFEWIKTIAENRLVVTDSYHAVLFSIYTKTPFRFLKWGAHCKRDARVLSLLHLFDLTDLAVDQIDLSDPAKINTRDIDWSAVEEKVNMFRGIGTSFINEALQ